ncbi:MAG: hypothetical protein JWM77_202 [Rhodospirillales bacterium]|nr:hypothetical protein [Rhodospirillales bacterium]
MMQRYHAALVALHWLLAVLIVLSLSAAPRLCHAAHDVRETLTRQQKEGARSADSKANNQEQGTGEGWRESQAKCEQGSDRETRFPTH